MSDLGPNAPLQPGNPLPANSQPGNSQPGNPQPANSQPGNPQPANSQPGNSQPANSQPGRLRLVTTNVLIVCLLVLIFVESFPCLPGSWKTAVRPITERLGIWQEHWNMFAPHVAAVNQRLVVQIGYENGETIQWQTPTWNKIPPFQRFAACRWAEFYDNVLNHEVSRRAWAKYLAQQHRRSPAEADRPRWVKIIVERHSIPGPPATGSWPSPHEPFDFEDREVLPKVKFP